MNRTLVIALIALLLGLTLGYLPASGLGWGSRSIPAGRVAERLDEALAEPNRIVRMERLAELFPRIPPAALDAVLASYRRAPLNGGDMEFIPLIVWWAGFDVDAAFRFTQSDRRTRYRRVVESLFLEWGRLDPRRALASVPALRGPLLRESSAVAVLVGYDEAPGAANDIGDLLASLPTGPDRQSSIRELVRRRLVAGELDTALKWADSLDRAGSGLRADIGLGAAEAIAERDPARAAAFMSDHIDAHTELPKDIPRRIGLAWVETDAPSAITWLASLPVGEAQKEAMLQTYLAWLRKDPAAAGAWLEARLGSAETPLDAGLEPALDVYARSLGRKDPERAIAHAQRLTSGEDRERSVVAILGFWGSRDREAAEAWMDEAKVSDELREAVEDRIEERLASRGAKVPKTFKPQVDGEHEKSAEGRSAEGER